MENELNNDSKNSDYIKESYEEALKRVESLGDVKVGIKSVITAIDDHLKTVSDWDEEEGVSDQTFFRGRKAGYKEVVALLSLIAWEK